MDNYRVLGLLHTASIEEVKTVFRKLSKIYHPDKTGGDKIKTEKFLKIKEAYDNILKGKVTTKAEQAHYKAKSSKAQAEPAATYRHIGIVKEKGGDYLVKFTMNRVRRATILGTNGYSIGAYDLSGIDRVYNLAVSEKDMSKADYQIKIYLYDKRGNSVNMTYKLKKPNLITRLWKKLNIK